MHLVLHAACVYVMLMVLFRIAGRRTLAKLTNFDFVLVLIISESTQQALVGEDHSLTAAFVVILTLVGLDVAFSILKWKFPGVGLLTDGAPLIIVRQGEPVEEAMRKTRVDVQDVLTAARERHGLSGMRDIEYAILETNGQISVIPRRSR